MSIQTHGTPETIYISMVTVCFVSVYKILRCENYIIISRIDVLPHDYFSRNTLSFLLFFCFHFFHLSLSIKHVLPQLSSLTEALIVFYVL